MLVDGESSLVGNFTSPYVNDDTNGITFRSYSGSSHFHAIRLSSILVCHVLLDLQEAHQKKAVGLAINDPLSTSQSFSIRSVKFMPALGSLAATIHPGANYDQQDEGIDEFHSEDLHVRPDAGESGGDVPVDNESAIMVIPRSGDIELAARL